MTKKKIAKSKQSETKPTYQKETFIDYLGYVWLTTLLYILIGVSIFAHFYFFNQVFLKNFYHLMNLEILFVVYGLLSVFIFVFLIIRYFRKGRQLAFSNKYLMCIILMSWLFMFLSPSIDEIFRHNWGGIHFLISLIMALIVWILFSLLWFFQKGNEKYKHLWLKWIMIFLIATLPYPIGYFAVFKGMSVNYERMCPPGLFSTNCDILRYELDGGWKKIWGIDDNSDKEKLMLIDDILY